MLHQDEHHAGIRWQMFKKLCKCFQPARRGADADNWERLGCRFRRLPGGFKPLVPGLGFGSLAAFHGTNIGSNFLLLSLMNLQQTQKARRILHLRCTLLCTPFLDSANYSFWGIPRKNVCICLAPDWNNVAQVSKPAVSRGFQPAELGNFPCVREIFEGTESGEAAAKEFQAEIPPPPLEERRRLLVRLLFQRQFSLGLG